MPTAGYSRAESNRADTRPRGSSAGGRRRRVHEVVLDRAWAPDAHLGRDVAVASTLEL
jgi:hypothetical protein